ncbi:hypothetical protein EZS27_004722 [termite gut metagenome]|uniref:HTH cro/C1-type domain-containing protein n=1 Tax=termite gut metagenome TaxID=433724 RepID=A0A5J4SPD9_9ZZZZ
MIKDRVIQLIEFKGLKKESFFEQIGMTSASFRGKAKNTPLNSTAIENILSNIPDANPEWLLTGIGSMLREESTSMKKIYPVNDSEQLTAGSSMLREERPPLQPVISQENEFYKELYEKEREKNEELSMKIGKMGNEIETLQKNYKALRKKNDICLKEEHHLQMENFISDLDVDVDCFEQEVPLTPASFAGVHCARKTRNPHIKK